ncbi:hypothetical protein O6H91_05G036600 [Diphasiastrum complanatum]|uniref:Uncharacterized protein n=1 Tax=Diphasiastrum complanatum TaxID=34168 RepID=A0ACC2DM96_DIPCM|nr:hypothetical protein O6H91_05G036600 [Diphasiastrum complanatum]
MDCITSSLHMQEKVESQWLPPGFRFHPTDEELIDYLKKKVVNANFSVRAILEVDLNKCEPWDLPARSKMGEKEWYFFTLRDRKYPTGMRTNRATEAGYWKGTGKDREVFSSSLTTLVGMKKTLVFYKGRAPKGEKTNWIIHEYRLEGDSTNLQLPHSRISKDSEWVVCRIFHKMPGGKKAVLKDILSTNFMAVCEDQLFLPPLHECPLLTRVTNDPGIDINPGLQSDQVSSFTSDNDALPALSSFMSDNDTLSALSSVEAKNSGHWTGAGDTCSVAEDSSLFETASGTFDVLPRMLRYPSYLDLQPMNLQGRELTVLSNAITKRKRESGVQSSPLLTKSSISWHEPKQHANDVVAVDFLVDRGALTTPCKIEPYMEVNETLQSGYRMLDKNVWMEGGAPDFECSQSLLNLSLPLESSLFEIREEMSPIMYRNGISSTEDVDYFWTY